ncbi:hypothetical protein [Bifidobacterium simiarum]|uniref:hypothetical protein n=1 Tax=Bifidobacterium simiarum TaxID=2045441 RepID=UPI001BDC96BA|nr:hypothetical protein [Bifidobacterium simiarum]MBT1166105.1 hypothetical protein [Bifidobacterium simiarum]
MDSTAHWSFCAPIHRISADRDGLDCRIPDFALQSINRLTPKTAKPHDFNDPEIMGNEFRWIGLHIGRFCTPIHQISANSDGFDRETGLFALRSIAIERQAGILCLPLEGKVAGECRTDEVNGD